MKQKKSQNKRHTPNKHRLKPLSLYPLKPEKALRLFMQVDPAKVRAGTRRLRRKRGEAGALPTG
jgi:hypothetical protein